MTCANEKDDADRLFGLDDDAVIADDVVVNFCVLLERTSVCICDSDNGED